MILSNDNSDLSLMSDGRDEFREWLARKVAEYVRAQQTLPLGYMTCSPGSLVCAIGYFATAERGLSVANLVDLIQGSAETVSRNLAVLERDGFVMNLGHAPCRYNLTAEGIAALYGIWGQKSETLGDKSGH